MYRPLRIALRTLWVLWVVACLGSFVLEVESPLYSDGISWVYWGAETDIGWRSSSLVRWGAYHVVLILLPVAAVRVLRLLGRRGPRPAS